MIEIATCEPPDDIAGLMSSAYPFVLCRWDLGVVFAQMTFGLDVFRKFASPADLIRGSE